MFVYYFLYTSYVGVINFSATYLSTAVHALTISGRSHTVLKIKSLNMKIVKFLWSLF